jgi:hypothetical protein
MQQVAMAASSGAVAGAMINHAPVQDDLAWALATMGTFDHPGEKKHHAEMVNFATVPRRRTP